jgi:hypothetical protein
MYGKLGTGTGIASGGVLPITGMSVLGIIVLLSIIMFAGLALLKLLPRHRHHRGHAAVS